MTIVILIINYDNRTEWSSVRSVITRVIRIGRHGVLLPINRDRCIIYIYIYKNGLHLDVSADMVHCLFHGYITSLNFFLVIK